MSGKMDWTNDFDKFIERMDNAPMGLRDAMIIVGDTFNGAMRCVEAHSGEKNAAAAVELTRLILELWPKRCAEEEKWIRRGFTP